MVFSNPFSKSGRSKKRKSTGLSVFLSPSRQNTGVSPLSLDGEQQQAAPPPTAPVTGAPVNYAAGHETSGSSSTKQYRDLWNEAVAQLDDDDRRELKIQLNSEGKIDPPVVLVIETIVGQVEAACEKYKNGGWTIRHGDGRLILDVQKSARTILRGALRSKAIVDGGVKFDPTGYSSIAWAIISFGLQCVQNDQDRLEDVFDAAALLADKLHQYANIEANYRLRDVPDVCYLEDKLCSSYKAILEYSSGVQRERRRGFTGRVWYSFYSRPDQPLQELQESILTAHNATNEWREFIGQEYLINESSKIDQKIDRVSRKLDQILEMVNTSLRAMSEGNRLIEAIMVRMCTKEDIEQILVSLLQRIAEGMDQPTVSKAKPQGNENGGSHDDSDDLDTLVRDVFVEYREFNDEVEEHRKVLEQQPEMRSHRTRKRNIGETEKIMGWIESTTSQLLWVNGNGVLGRHYFDACFVQPLVNFGDDVFESPLILRHFCGENPSARTNNYRRLVQSLIVQIFKQRPQVFRLKSASLRNDAEKPKDLVQLLVLFLECIRGAKSDCVFVIIDSIDCLQESQTVGRNSERQILLEWLDALIKDNAMLIKILVTASLSRELPASIEDQMALVMQSPLPPGASGRRLSVDIMRDERLLIPQKLLEIQEGRCQRIAFAHLPLLYPPNSIIYAFNNGQLQAYIVLTPSGMEGQSHETYAPFHIRLWSIEHSGKCLGKRYHDFSISQFQGDKAIKDLRFIPSGYLKNESEARERLIARGRRYCELSHTVHYRQLLGKEAVRAVIDQQEAPRSNDLMFDDQFNIPTFDNLKPRMFMVCSPTVKAYQVEKGTWIQAPVDSVADIDFDSKMLSLLLLDEKQKQLTLDLVRSHLEQKMHEYPLRVVSGQGQKGLTILLHGAPGMGKTFTTMCIAETVRRPLLSRTFQLDESTNLAHELSLLFRLAKRWKAIVAIEDADELETSDRTKAASLSRVIESYGGVLFLTTNKVGSFKEAALSRIDLPIYLPPLPKEAQLKIWKLHVANSVDEECEADIIMQRLNPLVTDVVMDISGRDIGDIVLAARRLAQSQGSSLQWGHIENMLMSQKQFWDYLLGVHGTSMSRQARQHRLRFDEFGQGGMVSYS
ncbi:hypothetical protein RB595_001334 [Gaeumannomyces hyphopodioides]